MGAAAMSITITLPWPDKVLSPNAGKASMWPAVKARKAYRELAAWEWLVASRAHGVGQGAKPCLAPPVVATITFTYTKKRDFDPDNHTAMCKPIFDGAKDAGVIVDDNADVFSIGDVKFVKGQERGVTVTLTARAR